MARPTTQQMGVGATIAAAIGSVPKVLGVRPWAKACASTSPCQRCEADRLQRLAPIAATRLRRGMAWMKFLALQFGMCPTHHLAFWPHHVAKAIAIAIVVT